MTRMRDAGAVEGGLAREGRGVRSSAYFLELRLRLRHGLCGVWCDVVQRRKGFVGAVKVTEDF